MYIISLPAAKIDLTSDVLCGKIDNTYPFYIKSILSPQTIGQRFPVQYVNSSKYQGKCLGNGNGGALHWK